MVGLAASRTLGAWHADGAPGDASRSPNAGGAARADPRPARDPCRSWVAFLGIARKIALWASAFEWG